MNNEQAILEARAKVIRGLRRKQELPGASVQVVAFLLTSERYGIESIYVSEVLQLKNLTLIPGAPSFIAGVINLRGKIISVMNLKLLLNLKEKGLTEMNKIIVLQHGQMEFGIIADAIEGTLEIFTDTLSDPPSSLRGIDAEKIRGITADGLILLKGDQILADKNSNVNQ